MKITSTEFSREFSLLLKKHKKTLTHDKSGIYLIDCENIEEVLVKKATVASEDSRNELLFLNKINF